MKPSTISGRADAVRGRGASPWLLAGLAWLALENASGCDSSSEARDWAVVERSALVLGVDVEGVLTAVDSHVIGPPVVADTWEFKIARLAPEGDAVEPGTEVVGFDVSELAQKLQEKQNEAEAARKELDKKRQSLRMAKRDQELALANARAKLDKAKLKAEMPENLSAQVDIRKARLELDMAERQVDYLERKAKLVARRDNLEVSALTDKLERAEARVREMQEYQERMSVVAPRPGTVIYAEDWRGDKKKVGDSVWRAQSVLEIVSLDRMRGDGIVAEMDASKVAEGQRVKLRLDALPDTEFSGVVTDIADTVQRKSPDIPEKVAHLDIELDTTDSQRMRPSMRFRGTVQTGEIRDALIIPIDAVFISKNGPVVYRLDEDGDEYAMVEVELGARNKTHVQVESGLAEGERVSLVDFGAAGGGS